jgi:tetratricopeptide (TPR) repeat protein
LERLTLCLIARDEERWIGDCLSSVQSIVDEIVVVDTGSRDATCRIAEEAGARVYHRAWDDDFSAARNATLEHVHEGFVLSLDADERLIPQGVEALRFALENDRFDCGLLPLHTAETLDATFEQVTSGELCLGEPIYLPRLMRRTKDLCWEGIVHEQVSTWLLKGRRAVTIEAPIVHYGAVPDLRAQRKKDQRNLQLLIKQVEQEPWNVSALTHLTREHVRVGETAKALERSAQAWQALERAGPRATTLDVVMPASIRVFLLMSHGQLSEAERVLDRTKAWSGEHPNLHLLRGVLCERHLLGEKDPKRRAQLLHTAEVCFERCLALAGKAYTAELLPGAASWAAATRLGTVLLLAGRPREARRAFERAVEVRPDHVEASLGVIEALVDSGDTAAAIRAAGPLMQTDSPDVWLLAAAAVEAMGQVDDLRMFLAQARAHRTRVPFIAEHRNNRMRDLEAAANRHGDSATPTAVLEDNS